MKHPIKHRYTKAVLFEAEIPDDTPSGLVVRVALEQATKDGANLDSAYLARAYLAGAYLARADLAGADLAGANLARADLAGADLARADLAGADLARANLARADLAGANLARADLAGADLAGANLARADLARANLDSAYLARAYLAGADLAGANLAGGLKMIGKRPVFQVGQIGSRFDFFVAYITDQGLRFDAGCKRQITSEAFEKLLADTHGNNEHAREYRAALQLIKVHAELWTPKTEAA